MNRIAGRVALIAAMIVLACWLRNRSASGAASPESAAQAWYDAAARGDDRAYLAAAGGDLRARLETARREQGAESFRRGLRDTLAGLRGLAVSRADSAGGGATAVEAELVFAGRNERQRLVLERNGAGWIVVGVSASQGARPPVAYGAPVNE